MSYAIRWICAICLTFGLMALASCELVGIEKTSEEDRQWNGLAFQIDTEVTGVAPKKLSATVTAVNVSDEPKKLAFGDRALELRAHRTEARDEPPVWTSNERQHPLGFEYGCQLYLKTQVLSPGDSLQAPEFTLRIPLYEIVGDGLGDDPPLNEGHYYFTSTLELNDEQTPAFPTGQAHLPATVDSLPRERVTGGIRFEANTTATRQNSEELQYTLTITNETSEPRTIQGSQSVTCPATLHGYHTELRRNSWYRHRQSDWSPGECVLEIPKATLDPGKEQVFERAGDASEWTREGPLYMITFLRVARNDTSEQEQITLAAGTVEP